MNKEDNKLMEYITKEVKSACDVKGWGYQIRRKWSVRHKPVSVSPIDDYEWKLIPNARGRLPDASPRDYEGLYYVLGLDKANEKFILQHSTSHAGMMGPHWEIITYTEISPKEKMMYRNPAKRIEFLDALSIGWLRDHILRLTAKFGPNFFSVT